MLSITINGVTISDYLDKYQCQVNEEYDTQNSFEAIDGTTNQTYLGDRRTLTVDFEPMSTTQINELYGAIKSNRDISISYIDPIAGAHTSTFTCVSLPAATYFEGETTKGTFVQYWTIPTITFVEKEIDMTGRVGGEEYAWRLRIGDYVYEENEISKDIRLSMSISTEGFSVGNIASYNLTGSVIIKGAYAPVRNDKVILYYRTKTNEVWSQWYPVHVFFLKEFSLYGAGKYLRFSAFDALSFLDNDYLVNYERDANNNIIPQKVSGHIYAVETLLDNFANAVIIDGVTSDIEFPYQCDDITLSSQSSTNARSFIQNVANSSAYNYRQELFRDDVAIQKFEIGKEIRDDYIIKDSERIQLDYNFQGESIDEIIIYCGAVNRLPLKIYQGIEKDYNIYFYGNFPASGYPVYSKTLEIQTPFYGISAELSQNIFSALIGTNFGTEFSCSKVKMQSIVPIGSRIFFEDNDGNDEFDNSKIFFYLTGANYTFSKTGIYASLSGSSRKATDSYYLGGMQRDMENRIKLNATYNNVLIDNIGIKLAAPKPEVE